MIDAIVGAVVMVVATTALALAVEVAEKSFNSAGRSFLSTSEQKLVENAGWDAAAIAILQSHLSGLRDQ